MATNRTTMVVSIPVKMQHAEMDLLSMMVMVKKNVMMAIKTKTIIA